MAYDHQSVEKAAQEKWAKLGLYETDLADETKEPYFLLVEYPYPSGDLHIGHWYAFSVTDIYARILRARGKNVLFPMGFDAFGLPAENAAIKNNIDPAEWTKKNIERMHVQLASMGASFDWSKEVQTCDPDYYHWTQWLFIKLLEHKLAERREAAVKWCPKDQTVLANEQVVDGHCERCGTEVVEKRLTQWFLKITEYADRLLADLEPLPWREEIKEAQRAWIGKSEGAYLNFPINGRSESVRVFTTRPDTAFGATCLVLAPEHPLVGTFLSTVSNKNEVEAYVAATTKKTERERSENKEKTGVALAGIAATNPATNEPVPVFISDFVLGSYGTGALMAVPGHDERDFEFAAVQNKKAGGEKHFIFDFDGVLGNTFESAIRAMVRMGTMPDHKAAREDVLAYARSKPRHTRDHTLTPDELAGEYEWTANFGKAMSEEPIELFEGFIDEIQKIKDVKIAIVSSGSKIYVEPAVKNSRLKPTHILAFEDHHSKEEKIERIAKDWGVSVQDVAYFTDTKADYLELKNSLDSQKMYGCAWGYLGADELREVMPAAQILTDFSDIHAAIERLESTPKIAVKQVIAPRYYQTTEPGTYRPEEPTTEKDGIITIIKHWKDEKYMALKWKQVAWGTFLTGGVDEGMKPEETVVKEIKEETGYLHPRFVKKLAVVDGIFYHVPKKKNQHVHGHIFYVELEDDAKEDVAADEDAKHEIQWLTTEELKLFLTPDTHQYSLETFLNGYKPYVGDGTLVNSGTFSGRLASEAKWDIVAALGGERATQYRIRDWLISRQRYWGCPIPIVYDPQGNPQPVPSEHLPWLLPTDVDFKPTGEAPLASSKELKERVMRIFGEGWTPEYDTFDTFMDSSWYFARYLDPKDSHDFSDQTLMKKWLPVNRYSGGAEHTTMHLLYSRFFTKALYDLALMPVSEPYFERFNRGLILGPDGAKMSKSKGNVINPDEFVQKYGADAVRLYLAFIGPYNEPANYPWQLDGVPSMRKFLERVIRMTERATEIDTPDSLLRSYARTAQKIVDGGDRFKFNTGVAALMSLMNELEKFEAIPLRSAREFLIMLAPFTPHLAEHLWGELEGEGSIHAQPWPAFDAALLQNELVAIPVQVGGKRRGQISLAPDASEAEAVSAARALPAVSTALGGKDPSRVVYVPGKIINLVP